MVNHGTLPAHTPITMAAHPSTTPAKGSSSPNPPPHHQPSSSSASSTDLDCIFTQLCCEISEAEAIGNRSQATTHMRNLDQEGGNRRCCSCVPTCCRSDDNKTCDHSLHSSDNRRLAEHKHIQAGPHQQTGCCTYVCVDDCNGGIYVGGKWVTSIEACPSQPQKTCTCKHEQHIVGRKTLTILCQSWSHLQNPTHSNVKRAYSADFTAQKLASMKLPMDELLLFLLQWY